MEFNKRSRTTNREQFALMAERMKLNGGIAKSMSNEPPEVVSVFWTSLSTDLNALGPPTKSLAEWKKVRKLIIYKPILLNLNYFQVWSDFKSSIKKKLSNNRIQMRATGGGPNREVQLTALEEEVAQLVNIYDAVAGVSGRHCGTPQGPSRGSHTDSAASEPSTSGAVNREEADNMENAENSNGNSSSPTSPQPQQRVPQRRTQLTLLKTQLDMQKKYYDNVVCNLKSQKRKMEDVANNLKKNAKNNEQSQQQR
ncbi:uncharacterized protein LOC118742278 isoform X1 [Rhagoletis pomonella]|uniref:uncharacterized protein LOC118742278 isoform X1 n=1 Tax=Rhagoletis pomonella TaxID=28610 RepID=UPI001782AAF1|nr:uncharacterized protein LOC118742278 isoform X1 [Rhagoletis pomonella]